MHLLVLGYFPLGLRIFTEFFFLPRSDSTLLLTISQNGEAILIFIITLCLGSSATYFAFNSRA